jgi:metacaspase-1
MIYRALCIGINTYPGNPLQNCVNDAVVAATRLEKIYGWQRRCLESGTIETPVRLAVNDRAESEDIRDKLKWLAQADRRILFQSGHGTQAAARNEGWEIDGLDEIFCAHDFSWSDESTWLRDDDYARLLWEGPPGAQTIFISDSCHSGDLVRDMRFNCDLAALDTTRGRERYLRPPADIEFRNEQARMLPTRRLASGAQTIAISACRSDQTCMDGGPADSHHGAFTGAFFKALENDPDLPLRDVVAAVNAYLGGHGYDQVAQFDAPPDLQSAAIWRP